MIWLKVCIHKVTVLSLILIIITYYPQEIVIWCEHNLTKVSQLLFQTFAK